ncbi:hypothetical protein FHS29_002563 [Saccharothrix tamanrassetensis]|uniref:Uncharacterized protein n=1 Tax=Saccharothrix tamanrassetensis TaxID=1051531 RepID=A0A841CBT8_9PSEU|nr:hypothetical protein [Saccharothrix tamanrassetensis]MBB5955982.1 hypothetical protein [Saccharothrix tamanrassetensis]
MRPVTRRSDEPVLLVRKRGERVGERDRSCHLVPLPDGSSSALIAYCGVRIEVNAAELLMDTDGMPCVACLVASPSR